MYEVRIVKHPGAGGGHRTRLTHRSIKNQFIKPLKGAARPGRGSDFPQRHPTNGKWERTRRILSNLSVDVRVRSPAPGGQWPLGAAVGAPKRIRTARAHATQAPRTSRLSDLRRVRVRHISIRLGGPSGGALRPNLSMRHLGWATHRPRPRTRVVRPASTRSGRSAARV
jgi:hypothetical protein